MKLRRTQGISYDPRVLRMLDRHVREQRGAAAIAVPKPDLRRRITTAA